MESLAKFLYQEKQKTNLALEVFFDRVLADPNRNSRYLDLNQGIKTLVLRGGKKARSSLSRLSYSLAGGKKQEEMLQASLYLELIHTFLLVHDDIADNDQVRYGGPTLEAAFKKLNSDHYGRVLAMIAGDQIRTLADYALDSTEFSIETKNHVKSYMTEVLIDTIEGWLIQYHLNFEPIDINQENDFLKGLELVTSRYSFAAPLVVGVILARGDEALISPLITYAHHTGIAFQIRDDILGVFGDSQQTGKPVGNDIREGKKTLLVLEAYKKSNTKQRKLMEKYLGYPLTQKQMGVIKEIIVETGSLDYSQQLASQHVAKAHKSLNVFEAKHEAIERLHQIADFVVNRQF